MRPEPSKKAAGTVTRAPRPLLTASCQDVAARTAPPHAPGMFVVTEAEAAAIRAVYEQRGEFSAAVELRRRFPGITDNALARECARTIAGWKPLPLRLMKRLPKPPRCGGRVNAGLSRTAGPATPAHQTQAN